MQREILHEALTAFEEIETPGEIKALPFRWSEDESWRENPMRGGGEKRRSSEKTDNDFRTPRVDIPQYQMPEDEEAFERQHEHGACGLCVGAE
ncbi:MAG: hypothetical protein VX252_10015 [Myxococcota bacterium]|nr:hypothetical protein [Myxococcota bacterium]